MNIHTLSLFPKLIENALNDGVIKKAVNPNDCKSISEIIQYNDPMIYQ